MKDVLLWAGAGQIGIAIVLRVGNIAILLSKKANFIPGSDFLIDGGATASYFYGKLKPE